VRGTGGRGMEAGDGNWKKRNGERERREWGTEVMTERKKEW